MENNGEKGNEMKKVYRDTAIQVLHYAAKYLPSEGGLLRDLRVWLQDRCLAVVLRNIEV
jgi:hypothetical protein